MSPGAPLDAAPGARITYVGHATVLLELDGTRVLTDPVLRRRVLHLHRHDVPLAAALRDLDVVLISHAHWDHLDVKSLALLDGEPSLVVVPRGVARLLRRRSFPRVAELAVGESVEIGGLTITATPADHDVGRGPLGARTEALGYRLAGTRSVYFAGDTDFFPEMAELAPVDLALLPVAGWGPRLPPGHLDPRRAAEALRLLRPRAAVPIHWGTYSLVTKRRAPDEIARQPALAFERYAAELAPGVEVHVLAAGDSLDLK